MSEGTPVSNAPADGSGARSGPDPHRDEQPPKWLSKPPRILTGAGLVVLSAAFLTAGIVLFHARAPRVSLVRLQWAGSAAVANTLVHAMAYGQYRSAIRWDMVALVPGYAIGLGIAGFLGWRVFWTRRMWVAALVGVATAVTAALCNLAQDVVLLIMLRHGPMRGTWPFRAAAALSFVKFSLLVVAGGLALIALATTIGRLAWHHHVKGHWERLTEPWEKSSEGADHRVAIGPPPVEGRRPQVAPRLVRKTEWWTEAGRSDAPEHWSQGFARPGVVAAGVPEMGICVSGGGIRSATVALGAMQSLQKESSADGSGRSELARARYLVSVSGGGYTAGAYQLALRAPDGSEHSVRAGEVFAPGSPEEDHLRRHSSYLADTLGQWLTALGVLLRCVATGIVLIGLAIVAVGLAIGRFYREVPVVTGGLAGLRPLFLVHAQVVKGKLRTPPPGWPVIPWGVTLAVLAVLGLAVVAYLVQVSAENAVGQGAAQAGTFLLGLTGLLVAIGVAIPALVWLSSWLSWQVRFLPRPAIATGSLAVVISYLGALAGTLWRKRTTITKTSGSVKGFFTKSPGGKVLPNSMAQMLLLWLCLAMLVLGAILASGWVATSGLDDSWWALLPVGVLLVIAIAADETWFSLYPFYRRRLASAFAVYRCTSSNGRPVTATPLKATARTPLSKWGEKVDGFPEVRLAAAANITGQDRTPPGHRAVSYVFGHDYVGGPQVGWVRTDFLENLVSSSIGRDLEVEAAMAISGAAFAAAMGRQTRFFEVFLALTNVRLGAWLPNPYFVALKAEKEHRTDWTVPGLPSRRRLSHLAREIFGIHPSSARMLLCTDGGHYDNLGLMELLRLRCNRIYCFDASGGGAPLADTLAGTIALAREELGTDIKLAEPYKLVPGEMMPPPFRDSGPLAKLNARISESAVIKGDITYPRGEKGTLIFAQAALTEDLPYEVLEYCQDDQGFPRDGTADQWFNGDQFDAYQRLGRYLGKRAADEMTKAPQISPTGS